MTILEDIQNTAVDGRSDLASILRKCKLLAARLNSKPLEDWVIWESNGYPEGIEVPDYRVWSLEVRGHFAGPFGSAIRNAPIPIDLLSFISKESRDTYKNWQCRLSVANIEETLRNSERDRVSVSTGNLAVVIGTRLYEDGVYNCVQTWAEFGRGHLVELLNTVRNRILDFALAMEKENPSAGEKGEKELAEVTAPSKVTQIFNTTVYGGAAQVVGTATNSRIGLKLKAQDFSALQKILHDMGVEKPDIDELKLALDQEPVPKTKGFGPKVSSWIGKMVGKAAEGGWQISAGAAGDLLAKLITQYYGI